MEQTVKQSYFNYQLERFKLYGDKYPDSVDWEFMYRYAVNHCGMFENDQEVKVMMNRARKEMPEDPHKVHMVSVMRFLFSKHYKLDQGIKSKTEFKKASSKSPSNGNWTPEDSFLTLMAFKEKHGKWPDKTFGIYAWAYDHAVSIGDIKHDENEYKKALKAAGKEVDQYNDPAIKMLSKDREEDVARFAKKHLFTKHYEK